MSTDRRPPTAISSLAALLLWALLLSACLPGGNEDSSSGGEDSSDSNASSDGSGSSGGEEPDEIVVWDIYVRGAEREIAERLAAEFEEEHGVTVRREPKTLDDLSATLPLAMSQDDGPDVASVNQGRADMGAIVKTGDLMDLTEFGREQGWFEAWGENLLRRNMFTEDGQEFGTGNLYGVSPQAEIVGWFYNRQIFDELGLEPPATFEELQQLLATLEQEGETPIAFGNVEGWPAIHTYGALEHTRVDTGYLNDLIFRTGDATFDTEANTQAASTIQDWAESGYFTENFSGIGYDDSWAAFAAGDGALLLTGSWIAGEFDSEQFGFFLTPGQEGSLPPQTGGMGVPLGIRASTQAPELAREYVAWMTSEEAAQEWVQAWLPSRPPSAEAVADDPLMTELVDAWSEVLEAGELGHYLDWASPTFYDTLTSQLQQLLAGRTSPQDFTSALQDDYAQSAEK